MKLFTTLSLSMIILCSSTRMVAKIPPIDQHQPTLEQQEAIAREELAQELEQEIGRDVPELRSMIADLLNPHAMAEFFTSLELQTAEFMAQPQEEQNPQSNTNQDNNE